MVRVETKGWNKSLVFLFIQKAEREREKKRENLPSVDSLLKWPQQLGRHQAESRNRDIHQGFPHEFRDPGTCLSHAASPGTLAGCRTGSGGSLDLSKHPCRIPAPKQWPNSLRSKACPGWVFKEMTIWREWMGSCRWETVFVNRSFLMNGLCSSFRPRRKMGL